MKIGVRITNINQNPAAEPKLVYFYFAKLRGGKLVGDWGESGLMKVLAEIDDDEMRAHIESEFLAARNALAEFVDRKGSVNVRADLDFEDDGTVGILVEGAGSTMLGFDSVNALVNYLAPDMGDEPGASAPDPSSI